MLKLVEVLISGLVYLYKAVASSKMIKSIAALFSFGFLTKAMTIFGVTFLTYQGAQFTLDFAYDAMLLVFQQMPAAPSQWLQVLWMGVFELRVDDALTNVLTAYAAAWSISSAKATSALALKA